MYRQRRQRLSLTLKSVCRAPNVLLRVHTTASARGRFYRRSRRRSRRSPLCLFAIAARVLSPTRTTVQSSGDSPSTSIRFDGMFAYVCVSIRLSFYRQFVRVRPAAVGHVVVMARLFASSRPTPFRRRSFTRFRETNPNRDRTDRVCTRRTASSSVRFDARAPTPGRGRLLNPLFVFNFSLIRFSSREPRTSEPVFVAANPRDGRGRWPSSAVVPRDNALPSIV